MDPLGNKIKEAIENSLNVRLVTFSLTREADMWLISSSHIPCLTYKVSIEVVQSKHKTSNGEYPLHDLHSAIRNDLFNKALDGKGKLISISTSMNSYGNAKSSLEFITQDVLGFADAMTDLGWKAYSKEFDSLIAEELFKD